MIDASLLNLLQPQSYLVNSARGGLIKIDDPLAALENGQLKGAALDVLPVEPPQTASAIVQHPRVLLSPHAAFFSDVAARELRRKAAQNLIDWDRNGRPSYVVVQGKNK